MTLTAYFANIASTHAAPPSPTRSHPSNADTAQEDVIPQTPSAPPSLIQAVPTDPFQCRRKLIYKGQTLDCDSQMRKDGERLRPIIGGVPDAVAELDSYQRGRRSLMNSAYFASLGLMIVVAGYLISRPPFDPATITTGGYFVVGGAATLLAGTGYTWGMLQTNPKGKKDYLTTLAYFGAASVALALLGVAFNHPPFGGSDGNSSIRPGGYLVLGGLSLGILSFGFNMGVQNANETRLNNAIENFNRARPDTPIELKLTTQFNF